jgi:hypothetical protein
MFLRPADDGDGPLLLDALHQAFNWTGEEVFTREQLLTHPQAGHYVVMADAAADRGASQ